MALKKRGDSSPNSTRKSAANKRSKKIAPAQADPETGMESIAQELSNLRAMVGALNAQPTPSNKSALESKEQDPYEVLSGLCLRVRTQLASVLGSLELQAQQGPSEEGQLNTIRDHGLCLGHGLADLSDFIELERQHFKPTAGPCAPEELMQETVRLMGLSAGAAAVEVDYGPAGSIPGTLIIDSARLRQVLFALGDSLLRMSPNRRAEFRVRRECDLGQHCWISFEFSAILASRKAGLELRDSFLGTGSLRLPDNSLHQILSFARRKGEALGWQPYAKNPGPAQVVLGITVPELVGLPRYHDIATTTKNSAVAGTAGVQSPASAPTRPERPRILIVEDDAVNRKITCEMVRRLGADPSIALSGEEALGLASRTAYDLILLDMRLPGMDGFDTARALRHSHGLAISANVPILALTADPTNTSRQDCAAMGIDDVLAKPIRLSELGLVLRAWLKGRL